MTDVTAVWVESCAYSPGHRQNKSINLDLIKRATPFLKRCWRLLTSTYTPAPSRPKDALAYNQAD